MQGRGARFSVPVHSYQMCSSNAVLCDTGTCAAVLPLIFSCLANSSAPHNLLLHSSLRPYRIPSDKHWIAVFCLACRSFLHFFLPLSVAPSKKPFFISSSLSISDGLLVFSFWVPVLLVLFGISPRSSHRLLPHIPRDRRLVAPFTVLYILLL